MKTPMGICRKFLRDPLGIFLEMCIEILKMSGLLNVGNEVRCLRKVVFPLLEGGDLYPSK